MNFKSKPPCRFALRKEYFGGLLLDFETTSYELITPKEFQFLKKLKDGESFFLQDLQNSELKGSIEKLQQKNIIQVGYRGKLLIVNIREIPTPRKIPRDYLSAPLKVFDTYTRRCNLTCKHCYASSGPNFIEVRRTLSQTEMIMRKFYEVGTLEWNFTGGEPTAIPDLLDAIRMANGFGMRVSLNTNGCWSSEISKKILTSGVKEIIISLEGREETNDKRRSTETFKRVVKTLNQIYEYNQGNSDKKLEVVLNTAVGKDNVCDIEFMVRLATKYGYNIKFVPLKPSGRASKNLSGAILSIKEYMEFAKRVQQLREDPEVKESGISIVLRHKDLFCPDYPDKSNFPYPFNCSQCSALTTAMDILPDGRVVACSFLMDRPEFIGPNILDVSVYNAWRHPTMERFRRAQKQDCANCRFYMKQCRGTCRSTVLLCGGKIKGNKLIGKDPCCFKDLLS
ncbi:MAG: radical SAM protein [Candidatus Omnitrophota bacterium]|nr:radical SAM protein [Candidatus Omnitrophota bacterium]